MINEEVLPNFGISPEIINKITWSKPVLNFGLPDKRVKELNDKITKKRNLPQGSFGSISTIIHSTVSSNTVAFNENLSTGICKVFWNKETNEVFSIRKFKHITMPLITCHCHPLRLQLTKTF